MGGMFTILKVRDQLARYQDPGWYDNPEGTLAVPATKAELQRDGIFDALSPGDAERRSADAVIGQNARTRTGRAH